MPVDLSYPKVRKMYSKVIPLLRTDNATEKCWLPKGAVIVDVDVNQTSNAVTNVGAVTVAVGSDTDGILNAFSMATTKVGLVKPGTAVGSSIGVQLTADSKVTSTYTVGSSTAGGEGYAVIHYFIPGPGESIYS